MAVNLFADDIREFLEEYGITEAQLSDDWIENRLNNFVVPYVEAMLKTSFSAVQTVTEYYSGNGKNTMTLNRRPVIQIIEIQYVLGGSNFTILNLGNIELIASEGVLKAKRNYEEAYYLPVFAKGDKNIKCTYTYGYTTCPAPIREAIIYLVAEQALGFVGARTGGGQLSGQAFSRSYGERGKWQDIRNDLSRQAMAILKRHMTTVVG